MLPAGTDPELLLGGDVDGESDPVPRNESRHFDDNVDEDIDEDFSDGSWLRPGPAERKW